MRILIHSLWALALLGGVSGALDDPALPAGQFRTADQLETVLGQAIAAACGFPPPAFEIARDPLCDLTQGLTYALVAPEQIEGGRNWFQIRSVDSDVNVKSYLLPVDLYWTDEVWVTVRAMRRGACLTAEDMVRKVCRHTHARAEVTFPEAPVGLCLTAPLASGGILTHALLEAPPVVERGSIVRLIYRSPGLTIAAKAKVLEDGRLGEAIRVKPLDARRVCQALVQNAEEVEVIVP